jgi:hypothetical protein
VYSATSAFAVPREGVSARLEDGTVDFLGIAALAAGFDALEKVCASAALFSQLCMCGKLTCALCCVLFATRQEMAIG